MKLQQRLMLAPLLCIAALITSLIAAGGLMNSVRDQTQQANQRVNAVRMQVAEHENKAGLIHAQLYRTMALAGGLNEAAIKKAHDDIQQRLDQLPSELKKVMEQGELPDQKILPDLSANLQRYKKAIETAFDMASVDINTGVAALQTADAEFAQLSKNFQRLNHAA